MADEDQAIVKDFPSKEGCAENSKPDIVVHRPNLFSIADLNKK
jgi:hypothetical protein